MSPLNYHLSFPQPETHCFRLSLSFTAQGQESLLALPAWIPGSYMIRDFAKHIVRLSAAVNGEPLDVARIDKQSWRLPPCSGEVRVEYEIYALDLSVRGAHLDDAHAYFNGTSLFLRVAGREDQRHGLIIERPEGPGFAGSKVATTLPAVETDDDGFGRYEAADYEALIDHPVEIARLSETAFDVDGVPHRMAFFGRHDADLARIARDLAPVCRTHGELFGLPLPITRYLFLVTVVGEGYGGLEHRDSTSLLCSRGDLPRPGEDGVSEDYRRFLGLCSHEYFHLWNVKRIRPERFARSDLSAEAYSELLWAFEGITSYYDDLALARAGVIDAQSYLELLARTITRLIRSGGRRKQSLAESSFYAWTKFYKQDENAPNAIVSYYIKGALVALGLDVELRRRSADMRSLDDLMRALWRQYGVTPAGVDEGDIERLVRDITDQDFADFFAHWVRGTAELPLADWLGALGVGIRLRPAKDAKDNGGLGKPDDPAADGKPVLGAAFVADEGGVRLTLVFDAGAAQAAGLSPGDRIIAVDGLKVTADTLAARIAAVPAGESVQVHAFRRDELRVCALQPLPAQADTCDLWLLPDAAMDGGVAARRRAWLGKAGQQDE